jgi:hypothetical protein
MKNTCPDKLTTNRNFKCSKNLQKRPGIIKEESQIDGYRVQRRY